MRRFQSYCVTPDTPPGGVNVSVALVPDGDAVTVKPGGVDGSVT
jgi:hypothetical protein